MTSTTSCTMPSADEPPRTPPPAAARSSSRTRLRRLSPREDVGGTVVSLDRFRRRHASTESASREERNRRRLIALAASCDPQERLRLRNAVVADNLPLVIHLAGRWCRNCQLPFEDLVQVGSMGLIRAVEAFDPARSSSLSSLAARYILGAMQHEVRDRQYLLRIPRRHWELRQRLVRLQDQRRREGLPPLEPSPLAAALGCTEELLRQTMELPAVTGLRSLDAPVAGMSDAGGAPCRLIDQLEAGRTALGAAPGPSPGPEGGTETEEPPADPRLTWLRQQQRQLDPLQRRLLEGGLEPGCTWVELGRELGMTPRQAQRRHAALLDRLQSVAQVWTAEAVQRGSTPLRASPMASRAARKV